MAEMDFQAGMVRMERKERGVLRVHLGSKVHWDPLHQTLVECSTLAGEEQPALVHLGQNWFIPEELEGVGMPTLVEEQTTSACQKTHSTGIINLECSTLVPYTEQSTNLMVDHYRLYMTTMCLVRFASLQCEKLCSCFQPNPRVLPPGLWSTLATSCQPIMLAPITAQCMNVWTKIQTAYQAVQEAPMVLCSTTLKPTAMGCHALLTTLRKNLPVQCAPSNSTVGMHYVT